MTVPPRPTATKVKARRRNGFISYARADYKMFEAFGTDLRSIERAYKLAFWSDKRINAGYHWEPEILDHINAADVIVMLLSPSFFASDYIWDKELPAIKARRALPGNCLVLPVVLKPCQWDLVSAHRQAVPVQNGVLRPIAAWKPKSSGQDCARAQIFDSIKAFHPWKPQRATV